MRDTLNLSLNVEIESRFTQNGWEPVDKIKIDKLSKEQKHEALKVIEAYNAPLAIKDILQLMARLAVISPEKDKAGVDVKARAAIWCEELQQYPADIVTKVLKSRYRWFPALAEVLEKCDNEVAHRKLIERGIRCYRTCDEY